MAECDAQHDQGEHGACTVPIVPAAGRKRKPLRYFYLSVPFNVLAIACLLLLRHAADSAPTFGLIALGFPWTALSLVLLRPEMPPNPLIVLLFLVVLFGQMPAYGLILSGAARLRRSNGMPVTILVLLAVHLFATVFVLWAKRTNEEYRRSHPQAPPAPIVVIVSKPEGPFNPTECARFCAAHPGTVDPWTERVPRVETRHGASEWYDCVVTASVSEPLPKGKLEQVRDGSNGAEDRWLVELPAGPQWVQIDLKCPWNVYAIAVWHRFDHLSAYHDVVVQASPTLDFTDAATLFNNDRDNSLGLGAGTDSEYAETIHGKVIDAKGMSIRYIRLYSNGSTSGPANHYTEVSVFIGPD